MKRRHTPALLPPVPANNIADRDLREVIHRFGSELTIADFVVTTGMPPRCIEDALVRLSREFPSAASVTESGELLYSFSERRDPHGGSSASGMRNFARIARAGGAMLHRLAKRTPLIVMMGYFILFLTFPFPPALILLAIVLSSWSDMDLLDFYADPRRGEPARIESPATVVSEYLAASDGLRERRRKDEVLSLLSVVRGEMGIITLEDVLSATGLPPENALKYLDEFLLRFTGEPDVTPGGRVVYRFSDLLRTGGKVRSLGRRDAADPPDAAEDGSSRGKHAIIALMNFANILFSVYYGVLSIRAIAGGLSIPSGVDQVHPGIGVLFDAMYSFAAEAHIGFVLPGLLIGLGLVPFSMAGLFFIRHFRGARRKAAERRAAENRKLRREVYAQVFASPRGVEPDSIRISTDIARGRDTEKMVRRIVDELAATYHAEIEEDGEGHFIYCFPELDSQDRELAAIRRAVRRAQCPAERVIFDSREIVR